MRLDRLARILDTMSSVDEFVAVERRCRRELRALGPTPTRSRAEDHDSRAAIYRDLSSGRGSVELEIRDHEAATARRLVADAALRTARAVGPPWRLPPPSAPARVKVSDPEIAAGPSAAADAVVARVAAALASGTEASRIAGAPLTATSTRVTVAHAHTAVRTSSGFDRHYDDTRVEVDLDLGLRERGGGTSERVLVRARRAADLDLPTALAAAARRCRDRPRAVPLAPGRYDLLLSGAALTASTTERPPPFAWLAPLVAQADGGRFRRGLTRYRLGHAIYGGARVTGDRLSLTSDGTIPFGWRSRPFGDLGEPVRRTPLVTAGVARGLSLELRDAALLGRPANGGIGNLVVAGGASPSAALRRPASKRAVVEVVDLAWLTADVRTGAVMAEISLAYLRQGDGDARPVRGGWLEANLFELLARVELAADTVVDGWYHGPAAICFRDVALR